jgi:hypothetical protein
MRGFSLRGGERLWLVKIKQDAIEKIRSQLAADSGSEILKVISHVGVGQQRPHEFQAQLPLAVHQLVGKIIACPIRA